jgi:hypothetical protein
MSNERIPKFLGEKKADEQDNVSRLSDFDVI